MARPQKKGLDYFPFDTDFYSDDKIMLLSAEFGLRAEAIITRLLCRIYKHGYFCTFSEDTAMLFAKTTGDGVTVPDLMAVVDGCMRRGLLDKALYDQHNILTSKGIQERFMRICKDSGRKFEILPAYDLTSLTNLKNNLYNIANPVCSEKSTINSQETTETEQETTHLLGAEYTKESKGKESKEKERELHQKTAGNEIWLQQTAMAYKTTVPLLTAYCAEWIPKAVARSMLEQYPVNKLISYMLIDFEKHKNTPNNGSTTAAERLNRTDTNGLKDFLARGQAADPPGQYDPAGHQYSGT